MIVVSAVGCSSSPTTPTAPTAAFGGTWQFDAGGTVTLTCSGQAATVWPVSQTTFTASWDLGSSALTLTMPAAAGLDTCFLGFTASGNTATMAGPQSCKDVFAATGMPATPQLSVSFLKGSLETVDGKTLTVSLSGSEDQGAGTNNNLCDYSLLAAATKSH
jgi:hypothetical protein